MLGAAAAIRRAEIGEPGAQFVQYDAREAAEVSGSSAMELVPTQTGEHIGGPQDSAQRRRG